MSTISLEDIQARLPEIIGQLAPGEELVITRDDRPVVQLIGLSSPKRQPVPGRGRGKLVILAEDDEHLNDFADDMP